jgi:glycine/D-amino acid oxidase-like deaminating enzyme
MNQTMAAKEARRAEDEARDITRTTCCIVGGGPAGAVLSLLLARKGVDVTLLEAHRLRQGVQGGHNPPFGHGDHGPARSGRQIAGAAPHRDP